MFKLPGPISNNLIVDGDIYIYSSDEELYSVSFKGDRAPLSASMGSLVTSISFCEHNVLVTCVNGSKLLSAQSLKSSFFLSSSKDDSGETIAHQAGAISTSRVCIGASDGSLQFFTVEGNRCLFDDQIPANENGVQCMNLIGGDRLVVGRSNGEIEVWDQSSQGRWQNKSFDGFNDIPDMPVCVVGSDNVIIAGFVSGRIKIWKDELIIEAQIHGLTLTGLAMHPKTSLVASCAEDGVLNVFEINLSSSSCPLKLIKTLCPIQTPLVGVVWHNDELSVIPFDREGIWTIRMI